MLERKNETIKADPTALNRYQTRMERNQTINYLIYSPSYVPKQ